MGRLRGQGAGSSSSGASLAVLHPGGTRSCTVGGRLLFGLVARDSWRCAPPSWSGGGLDPIEVIPGGTPGDNVAEEQEDCGGGATCR